jgi:hypothetical protein
MRPEPDPETAAAELRELVPLARREHIINVRIWWKAMVRSDRVLARPVYSRKDNAARKARPSN